jgi:iron complex outermembrane recepter protein
VSCRVLVASCLAALALESSCQTAFAQRADENALASAEDAFGTRVGNEGVGLYDSRNARGFDPQQAGNMRLYGLYFDQQALFGPRLQRSQAMRVGLTAQSFPFPAPTGIVDTSLIMPADRLIVSAATQYAIPTGQRQVTIDISTPLIKDKLGMFASGGYTPSISDWNGKMPFLTAAALWRWTPTQNFEAIPFIYFNQQRNADAQPQIFTGGAYGPPRFDRGEFFGQDWADRFYNDLNAGIIMRGAVTQNWRLQGAVFHSDQDRLDNFVIFYRNTQSSGVAELAIRRDPRHRLSSTSGEVRATGVYTQGAYRHTVHVAVRGRDTARLFGGGHTISLGQATIGVYSPVPQPTFSLGVRDRDDVNQITPGVSYGGQWAGIGEFSVGLQKSFYSREFGKEKAAPTPTKSRPWLYNATATATPSRDLAIYAGYTRGIEEFGSAPDNAANAGAPMPAALTEQVDAGFRYRIVPGVSLVAGVFEVSKPHFDRDQANFYTDVARIAHRGIEVSLTGRPIPGLTVVAGSVLLRARISGLSVDRGLIGDTPPGTPGSIFRLSLQYGPSAWDGFSVDTQTDYTSSQYANRANSFSIPPAVTFDAGLRYAFKINNATANIRAQVRNVLNSYDWTVDGASGRFGASPPRRFFIRLAADL